MKLVVIRPQSIDLFIETFPIQHIVACGAQRRRRLGRQSKNLLVNAVATYSPYVGYVPALRKPGVAEINEMDTKCEGYAFLQLCPELRCGFIAINQHAAATALRQFSPVRLAHVYAMSLNVQGDHIP